MRTGAGVIKYAVFNVLNGFQTYSNSIDCTITTFDVFLCNFFFTMLRVQISFMPFWGSANVFLKILPLTPPPPPEINWSVPKIIAKHVNRIGEFQNSAPIIFHDSSRAVLYASNACRKLMTRRIKNPQHGIRA